MTHIISTDEDPGLRIESFAVINLRGVSTNKTIICFTPCKLTKNLFLDLMISCKYILFLQDFVNFKSFLRKKGERIAIEGSKGADVNEGKS